MIKYTEDIFLSIYPYTIEYVIPALKTPLLLSIMQNTAGNKDFLKMKFHETKITQCMHIFPWDKDYFAYVENSTEV